MLKFKSIIVLFIIFIFSSPLFSQKDYWKNKTPEEIAEKRAEKLKTKLALDDLQHKKIYEILLTFTTDMKTLREQKNSSSDVDKKALRDKIRTLRKETYDKIISVLNPEQRAKFEEMKKNRMEKKKSRTHREKRSEKNKR